VTGLLTPTAAPLAMTIVKKVKAVPRASDIGRNSSADMHNIS
jgi:hypothetical protein